MFAPSLALSRRSGVRCSVIPTIVRGWFRRLRRRRRLHCCLARRDSVRLSLMRFVVPSTRVPVAFVSLIFVAACRDATAPVRPASIKLVAGDSQDGAAGEALPTQPTFEVYDAGGVPLGGL